MTIETLKDLAHELQEVCAWAQDNGPVTEDHVTQIVQTALNMPTALRSGNGKGLFTFIPHRQVNINQFRDNVLRKHPGCNIDTTFNYCQTIIVFGICQEEPDEEFFPLDQVKNSWSNQQRKVESEWWSNCQARLSQSTPLGGNMPYWLKNQIVCHTLALTAAALESRRLGYAVQFLTVDPLSKHFYNEYPDLIGKPYIPMHCLLLGTKPSIVKMSHRRNRSYQWVKDKDSIIQADQVTMDQKLHYDYDKFRLTPNGHEHLRNTYTPV